MKLHVFLTGLVAGAVSWAICYILFGISEPYDTPIGFGIGQLILITTALYVSNKHPFSILTLNVFAMYIGINAYAYIFARSGERSWWTINLVVSVSLTLLPFFIGIGFYIVKYLYVKIKGEKS